MTAMQSNANPPKREMPAFLQNMMQANDRIICTAKGEDVGKASITDLLKKGLRIPIFQRRYCWGKDQWNTLLNDAMLVVEGQKEKHSLGRITCVKNEAENGRLLVIDGQQRNTTCTLLLAAIRDFLCVSEDAACKDLAEHLDATLFPHTEEFRAWLADDTQTHSVAEGASLNFAALLPTYCDRASYFAAILPPYVRAASKAAQTGEWQRPFEAKAFYVDKLKLFKIDQLVKLANVILNKLEWLFFPISVNGNFNDGTEDLQVIYERLAIRDAQFCKPHRDSEFACMGAADFIRNLLLGSFQNEADAVEMYKLHWLPIEQAAADASVRSKTSNIAEILEKMFKAFLDKQPELKKVGVARQSLTIGGQLYPRFRKWFTAAFDATSAAQPGESGDENQELRVAALLRRLQDFAVAYFKGNCDSLLDNFTIKEDSGPLVGICEA